MNRRQAETGARAFRLRRIEGIEGARCYFVSHPRAAIDYLEPYAVTPRRACRAVGLVRRGDVVCDHTNNAPARHRVAGVQDEVEQDALELPWVKCHRPEVRRELQPELDVLAERAEQKRLRGRDDVIDPHRIGCPPVAAAEGHEPRGQVAGTLRRAANLLDLSAQLGACESLLCSETGVGEDDAKMIVKVVGDAACKPCHALEPSRGLKLVFQPTPFSVDLSTSRQPEVEFVHNDRR